ASSVYLPFDKEMPHFLLVASTTIKSKSQTRVEGGFSCSYREKFSLTPVHFSRQERGRRRPRSNNRWLCDMGRCFVAGVTTGPPSVINTLSPAARLPRVRNAEAAVARDPLPHAHLEGWQGAILVHGPSADLRQCAPRHLVGLACPRIEGHGRRDGSRDEDDSHGGLRGYGPRPSSSDHLVEGIYALATARGHGHVGRLHRARGSPDRCPPLYRCPLLCCQSATTGCIWNLGPCAHWRTLPFPPGA